MADITSALTRWRAVCLETAEEQFSTTSAAFLRQLRANHAGPLVVSWDNGPAHGGEAVRDYLATLDLALRLASLPAYSPDFNPDEALWAWARGGHRQHLPRDQGGGAGADAAVLRRAADPYR